MRVTVEKWTVTTLKKKSTKKKRKKSPQLGATATGATSSSSGEEANEYLLEEHTEQEQNLYGRLSSDEQTQDEELESPVDNPAKSVLVNQTNSAQSPFKYIQLSSSLKIPKQKISLNERILDEMEKTTSMHRLNFDEQTSELNDDKNENNNNNNNNDADESEEKHEDYNQLEIDTRLVSDDRRSIPNLMRAASGPGTNVNLNFNRIHRPREEHVSEQQLDDEEESWLNRSKQDWTIFYNYLNVILDLFAFRDTSLFLEEFSKLEAYLNSEYESNKNENETYFLNQTQIIDYINNSIKIKLLRLSQSSGLFDEMKRKLFRQLETKLSKTNMNECAAKFEKYERNYFYLFDLIKAKLKLKMSKLQNYVRIWNEFDLDCTKLDEIFNQIDQNENVKCNLQYRSKIIEITNYLNKLKEALSTLASVCNEIKYFELKNRIIAYEIRFKKFKQLNKPPLVVDDDDDELIQLNRNISNSQIMHSESSHSNRTRQYDHNHNYRRNDQHQPTARNPQTLITRSKDYYPDTPSVTASSESTTGHRLIVTSSPDDEVANSNIQIKLNRLTTYPIVSTSDSNSSNSSSFGNRYTVSKVTPIKIIRETTNNQSASSDDLPPSWNVERSAELRRRNPANNTSHTFYDSYVKKAVITSDKSTATINDTATQTDDIVLDDLMDMETHPIVNITPVSERLYTRKPGESTNHRETEGKKLLLEAYLRNNDNLASLNAQSTSSSSASSAAVSNKKSSNATNGKMETATIATRESGIGTANDDEVDSSHSAVIYDSYSGQNSEQKSSPNVILTKPSDENNNTSKQKKKIKQKQANKSKNLLDESTPNDNHHKLNAKLPSSKLSTTSSCSTSIMDSAANNNANSKLTYSKQRSISIRHSDRRVAPSPLPPPTPTLPPPNRYQASSQQTKSFIKRLLNFLILFLIPLLFLLFVYFVYIYFLNPSCCDFKRNYLFINVS